MATAAGKRSKSSAKKSNSRAKLPKLEDTSIQDLIDDREFRVLAQLDIQKEIDELKQNIKESSSIKEKKTMRMNVRRLQDDLEEETKAVKQLNNQIKVKFHPVIDYLPPAGHRKLTFYRVDVKKPVRLEVVVPTDFQYGNLKVDKKSWLPQSLTRFGTQQYEEGEYIHAASLKKADVFFFKFDKTTQASSVSLEYFESVCQGSATLINTTNIIVSLDMKEIHLFKFYSSNDVEEVMQKKDEVLQKKDEAFHEVLQKKDEALQRKDEALQRKDALLLSIHNALQHLQEGDKGIENMIGQLTMMLQVDQMEDSKDEMEDSELHQMDDSESSMQSEEPAVVVQDNVLPIVNGNEVTRNEYLREILKRAIAQHSCKYDVVGEKESPHKYSKFHSSMEDFAIVPRSFNQQDLTVTAVAVNTHDTEKEKEGLLCIAGECKDDFDKPINGRKAQLFANMTKVAADVANKAIEAECFFNLITVYGLLLIYSDSTKVFKLRMDFQNQRSSIVEHVEELEHNVAMNAVFSFLLR